MHPTRLRRFSHFDYTGPHRYSLTLCAFQRESIFTNADLVSVVVEQILRAATDCGVEILAYCFMPDHVHVVAQGVSATGSLPDFVQRAKQRAGFHGKRLVGRSIWQTGYFERVLRENEDTRDVVAYVLANPVRAGLVAKPDDWPFSGSGVCSFAELLEYVQDRSKQTM